MRIGFDISPSIYTTGVGLYTKNLVSHLSRLVKAEDLVLYGSSLRGFSELQKNARKLAHPQRLYRFPPKLTHFLFHQLNVPIEQFVKNIDVFHSWDWYIPRGNKAAIVTTVHDLALFKFPALAHQEIHLHHSAVLKRINALQATVIAVSETTKADLIELFNIPSERVHVIPEALPEGAKVSVSENDVKNVMNKYSITKPYLISVGTKEPRKNYPRMMAAWEKYQSEYNYVIVGKPGWETVPQKEGVIFIESVSKAELAALYTGASALLYASLYEGFGFPILEAFYYQIPVVTANISSMPEVAGKGAVLVDPLSVDSIGAGIETAIEQKNDLVAKGIRQLEQFSWEKTATHTLEVYKKAYER